MSGLIVVRITTPVFCTPPHLVSAVDCDRVTIG